MIDYAKNVKGLMSKIYKNAYKSDRKLLKPKGNQIKDMNRKFFEDMGIVIMRIKWFITLHI